jgi:hypothetical protein
MGVIMNIRILSLFIAIALPAGLFGMDNGRSVVRIKPKFDKDKPELRKSVVLQAQMKAIKEGYQNLTLNLMSAIDAYTDAGENPFQAVGDAAAAIIDFGGKLLKEIPHADFPCLDFDHKSETPLTYAIKKGKPLVAQLLIEKGASLDVPNGEGKFPIDCAVSMEQALGLDDRAEQYQALIQYMDYLKFGVDFSDPSSDEEDYGPVRTVWSNKQN